MSCGCQTSSSNCVREPFNANFVRPLTFVRGVDANGCVSYAPIGDFAINVNDTNTVDLTLNNGALSANVVVSPNTGNVLQALANGLFVPAGAGLSVQDTQSVDLTLTGNTLSAAVRISNNPNNQLQLLANGLYVPPSAFTLNVTDTITVDLTLIGNNLSAQVIVSPNSGNALQTLANGLYVPPAGGLSVQDTNTVDLTLTGNVLSAQAVVSPNPGNALQALPNGLFVPPGAGLTVQDTQSVDLTLVGNVISADVIISPNAGNQLQLLPNGLYVAPSTFTLNVQDTNTVDLTLVGSNLSAQVIVSPNAGNALQVLANGLFVPTGAGLTVQDTNTIDLTLIGGVLSAQAIISPNPGNALQALPNGLYVSPGNYALNDCANNPLPTGTQVLTCPAAPQPLNITNTLLSFLSPNTGQRTMSGKQCPEPELGEYILIADNSGNVRYTRMREAVFHSLLPGSIIMPNIPLVTLQPPNTNTGVIDSASFTNPLDCEPVFPRGGVNGTLKHSFNQSSNTSVAFARVNNAKDLISQIDTYNTPGITNTPLTNHAWRNQSIPALGFTSHRVISLAPAIAPAVTVNFNRSVFTSGATDFYYVTMENWFARINTFKL